MNWERKKPDGQGWHVMSKSTIVLLLLATVFANGCATTPAPKTNDDWGPGVKDIDRVRVMLQELAKGQLRFDDPNYDAERWVALDNQATGIMSTLTWKQAAYLCRTAPTEIKLEVELFVIPKGKDRIMGATRQEVLALLGPPDQDWGDGDMCYGPGGDEEPKCLVFFDESGRVNRVYEGP
jgi:hypothetical protein